MCQLNDCLKETKRMNKKSAIKMEKPILHNLADRKDCYSVCARIMAH
ncbi:MAG: hypothetical protein ACFFDW_04120 [Candidatus Thorarchaeota archaeon]